MARAEGPPAAPDVSVVVVNFNGGDDLTRCVRSVFDAAGDARVEAIVVDNASHDGSARLAAERTPQARLIENPTNQGLSAAWNQGARAVDAPWVLFLNPDTEIARGDFVASTKPGYYAR